MKHVLQHFGVAVASVMTLSVVVAVPAYARQGSGDQLVTGTTLASQALSSDQKKAKEAEVLKQVTAFQQQAVDSVKALEAKQDATKKHTEQERQKSCEARSTEITNKLNKKVADAQKHKAVFDKIFARVKEFHDTKNLTTPNYDALLVKANDAQIAADTSIASLKAFDTTIDCTQVDAAATKVAAFREALKATRDSLKAYRTSIKDLLVAVKASVPVGTTTTNTSGTTTAGN